MFIKASCFVRKNFLLTTKLYVATAENCGIMENRLGIVQPSGAHEIQIPVGCILTFLVPYFVLYFFILSDIDAENNL